MGKTIDVNIAKKPKNRDINPTFLMNRVISQANAKTPIDIPFVAEKNMLAFGLVQLSKLTVTNFQ